MEMEDIYQSFRDDVKSSILLAHSLIAMGSYGQEGILKQIEQYPEAGYQFVVPVQGTTEVGAAIVSHASNKDILSTYLSNPGAVQELVHARLVQRWYDFLSQIFEHLFKSHFLGTKPCPSTRSIKFEVDLDFSTDTSANLIDNLQERAVEGFRFFQSEKQLETVEKMLGTKVAPDFKKDIKKHIVVRNIFQHANGIVRPSDLALLGLTGKGISLIDESARSKEFQAKSQLRITFYELVKVGNDFCGAAKLLTTSPRSNTSPS
ncbi:MULTISPECIES: hypothetical protein [Trichocoleus]|uniref:Uncharacterized protein n=1 Tax=Trichocoleus desertorum GB2-A4 TaxID=2933944 RepID=A0ABV0JCR0_9CYAN|nr:hypothetical protein [Trichocoleus sp. FACHB-46]MBD1864225.1 hypothetical protein [Trichocoleus sp. FACHB-46]